MFTYRLNWKFLVGFLAVLAVSGGLLHARYTRQLGRQADTLMELANKTEEKQPVKAAGYLRRYLVFRPDDHDARGRLGLLLARTARQPRELLQAYLVLDETVRSTDRDDLRRKAVVLALRLGPNLLPDVKKHLDELFKTHSGDSDLYILYAEYHLVQSRYADAAEQFRLAAERRPDLHAAHLSRARLLREKLEKGAEGDEVIAGMLARPENKTAFRAHLAAAAYWDSAPNDHQADRAQEVGLAAGLAPDEVEVILAVADLDLSRSARAALTGKDDDRKKWLNDARAVLRKGLVQYAPTLQKLTLEQAIHLENEALSRRAIIGLLFQRLATAEAQAGDLSAAETVARDGTEALPEVSLLLATLADIHIRQERFPDAAAELDRLEQGGYPLPNARYHRGRIQAGKGEWLIATRTLEEVLAEPGLPAEFVAPASLLLGGCYEEIGELDKRYVAYKKATVADVRDPLWLTANERLAATLLEMGLEGEAVRIYEDLAPRVAGANVPLARVRLSQILRKPTGQRDWSVVEHVLRVAPKIVETELVWADLEAARGDVGKATERLKAAIKDYPDAPQPTLALALAEGHRKNADQAARLIEAARSKFGHTVAVRLTEARLAALTPGRETQRRFLELSEGTDQLSRRDVRRLLQGLIDIAIAAGAGDTAVTLRDRVVRVAPLDISAHLAKFDDALARKDLAAAAAVSEQIQKIEPGGTNSLVVQAFLLISRAQQGDPAGLKEAGEFLEVVERTRPWWHRVALAQALVADLKGEFARAAARYKDAVIAGERRPDVIQRLLILYTRLEMHREAE
ncbi:MAG TPA: hypothetical protein VH092_11930, partial [Urbifossiella sp.]|nr:hypothetical protein [Urbifossiella sp.]